jgi:hypothetical protein
MKSFSKHCYGSSERLIKKLEETKVGRATRVSVAWKLSTSGLFGFVQSRLYLGAWEYKVAQDFIYTYEEGSWASKQNQEGFKLDAYNSSSYAANWLIRKLSKSRKGRPIVIRGGKVVRHKLNLSDLRRERADGTTSLLYRRGTNLIDLASTYARKIKSKMQETVKRPVYFSKKTKKN